MTSLIKAILVLNFVICLPLSGKDFSIGISYLPIADRGALDVQLRRMVHRCGEASFVHPPSSSENYFLTTMSLLSSRTCYRSNKK